MRSTSLCRAPGSRDQGKGQLTSRGPSWADKAKRWCQPLWASASVLKAHTTILIPSLSVEEPKPRALTLTLLSMVFPTPPATSGPRIHWKSLVGGLGGMRIKKDTNKAPRKTIKEPKQLSWCFLSIPGMSIKTGTGQSQAQFTPSNMSKESELYVVNSVFSNFSTLEHHILPILKLRILGKLCGPADNSSGLRFKNERFLS